MTGIRLLRMIGEAIVASIGGFITGLFVLAPLVEQLVNDQFYSGVISGAAGFMIWYLILELLLIWIDFRSHKPQ